MAVTTPNLGYVQQKGIDYTKVTDSSSDWSSIPNLTYFFDKTDKMVHYKNASGTVLNLFGSSSGSGSNNTTGNVLYVSSTGSDSDLTRAGHLGDMDKPFLTLKAARDAAISGDVIYVHPQTFIFDNRSTNGLFWNSKQADINLWKNGVTYYWSPGCKVIFYNQTITGVDLYLYSPTTTTGETCTVLGYLEYEQYSIGTDSTLGSSAFYSTGEMYGSTPYNSNAHTFYAQVKSLYSGCNEYLNIKRNSVGVSETKITIITDTEKRAYAAGQSGYGSSIYISGVINGVTPDPFLNLTLYSRYRDLTGYPFYIRGNLKGSSINLNGEILIQKNKCNLLRSGSFDINYNIKKMYYTTAVTGSNWLGSVISASEVMNTVVNIKGDLIDYVANSSVNGIFHIGNISNNNTINFDGNIVTNVLNTNGKFIAMTDGVVTGNTININADISYIGASANTVYAFVPGGGTGNTINYRGKMTGNFSCAITYPYQGEVNINNSYIKSTINTTASLISANAGTNVGKVRINNSYIDLTNTSYISNGSYINQYITNSTIINQGSGGLSNTTNFGSLQLTNSTIITGTAGATSINYTGTSPVTSANGITNNIYTINTLSGNITTITEITA